MVRRFSIGYDVELHKRTLERSLLSLLGPRSAAMTAGAEACAGATEHRPPRGRSFGEDADADAGAGVRTDTGVDLLYDSADLDAPSARR